MWKAAAGAQINIKPEPVEDDDWETDPDFVNDVTEEQQRWGSNTVQGSGRTAGAIDMDKLRRETEEADKKKKQQELLDGPNAAFGYGGKFGVQKDRMDQSAVGHDYFAKVEKHVSQKDYSTGFGGKFGIQSDRVDKSALSWEHKEKIEKHASQKDYTSGFGGKFGVQKDRQDKSALGWDHVEKLQKHESQKDYVQGFGGKFGVQKDRQDKSALGWDHHEAPQKHESQTDHKIGFGGKFGVQTDRMDKSALTFDEECTKVGTVYTKVKPDIGGAKPSDLRARFERMASDEGKTSSVPSSPAPRGNIHSKAAIFTSKQEEKAVSTQENVTKFDQSKVAFLTQSNETETNLTEKAAPSQIDKSKIECFTSTETATNITTKAAEISQTIQEQKEEIKRSSVEIQEEVQERKPLETKTVKDDTKIATVLVPPSPTEDTTEDYSQEDEIVDTGLSATALYDYTASADDEISFDPGDLITHIEMIDQGWWRGMSKGCYGLFPANYESNTSSSARFSVCVVYSGIAPLDLLFGYSEYIVVIRIVECAKKPCLLVIVIFSVKIYVFRFKYWIINTMAQTATDMNWGNDLWDQYDNLASHTTRGIEFLEKYGNFVKDRTLIEFEYASKLRRLVKTYNPKKKDDEDLQFSTHKAFKLLLNEINDLAGQHEVIAENLQANVIKELCVLVKDLKDDRKKHLNEGSKLHQNLTYQIESLFRSKKAYDKAYKESEKATENYHKADADLNLSRAEVEKQRSNMSYKRQLCDSAKNDYADQLQRTNDLQRQHYRSGMPDVFRQLQELDEKRIKNMKNFIYSSVDIERKVFPIINKCLDGIERAADVINEKEDTLVVIEKYKSGFHPPEDFPFEELPKSGSETGSTPNINSLQVGSKVKEGSFTVKGTISGKGIKKRAGIFNIFSSRGNAAVSDGKEDFSDLAPNQRMKKLKQRVKELQNKVAQETAARDGLLKMKTVYEANPALGNPMTVEGQLNECSHKLEKMQQELRRYQGYLEDAVRSSSQLTNSNSQTNSPQLVNGSRNHRNSAGSAAEEESLSRSASDSSVTNPTVNHNKQSAPGTPHLNHGPESGLGTSHTSLPGADSDPDQDQYDYPGTMERVYSNNVYDSDHLPPLGVCKALYPFEVTSEGSIAMTENEELHLIEVDQGDGWTRVRRKGGDCEEGLAIRASRFPLLVYLQNGSK
ncbi:Repeat in HS1/Cortactin [Popillia japonica]|uniref:Repeat in HS1/Cortactin n=1 Tax=Popillia japonica TaxID=7064 RepID=A0AAW1LBT4_POPJA